MSTTKEDIKEWLNDSWTRDDKTIPMKELYSHMLVVCDTFDCDDYPVHIKRTEDVHERMKEYSGVNMQKIMEVYNYDMDLETQINEHRANHV